jgi:multimeric flavodoxin WrbA
MPLTAAAINATLKTSDGESSSTDAMIDLIAKALAKHDIPVGETVRLADHDIKPGVKSDEGKGDGWPPIRKQILDADILIFGTPIWMGQPSSIAKRVLERMDAFLGETDDEGRTPAYGKVVLFAIVGNEDGAHCSTAMMAQALNDVGWTIPPASAVYWVGEAMGSTDFKELDTVPNKVRDTATMAAANAVHLATFLAEKRFPGMA